MTLITLTMWLSGKGTLFLGFVAGILTMATAYFQWSEKDSASKKNKIAQDSLKQLNEQTLKKTEKLADAYKDNATLQKEINQKSDAIVSATKKLFELSETNAKLQQELNNQITGGNNFPTLDIWTHSIDVTNIGKAYVADFDVCNNGQYALHYLSYALTDFSGYSMLQHVRVTRSQQEAMELITD